MFQILHIELGQCRLHTAQPYLVFLTLALTWVPSGDLPKEMLLRSPECKAAKPSLVLCRPLTAVMRADPLTLVFTSTGGGDVTALVLFP